jgi:phosphate transport system permease protein
MLFDPTAPLSPSGNLRRRQIVNALAESAATAAALIALTVLGIVIWAVVARGASAISWDFLTKNPPAFGAGGGIAPAIVGTIVIVTVATLMAAPVGILTAIYLTEFARGRIGGVIRLTLDVLNGVPSIVIGVFVFGLLVRGHHQSGFAAAVALAIIELPLVARAAQEVLLLVPGSLREAADALGVARWRSVLTVILPTAMGGILTGTVLAVARAAGETAPLLLVSSLFPSGVHVNPFSSGLSNIPVYIFNASEQADPNGFTRAWGAALVLMAFILISSLGARALLARSRRKLNG